MAKALAELAETTGKLPFVFSLCEWGWVCCQNVDRQPNDYNYIEPSMAVSAYFDEDRAGKDETFLQLGRHTRT